MWGIVGYDSYMNISSIARCILYLVYALRWYIQMFIQLKPTLLGRFEPSSSMIEGSNIFRHLVAEIYHVFGIIFTSCWNPLL